MPAKADKPKKSVITPMPEQLIQEIDEYRWTNRLPSRAAAIRELVKRGLRNNHKPR
jgi:metal-responsive CopG/Arc/MetJ family transcriptional regulator